MRILLLASAYNSMTQRVHFELADRGHQVSVELALSDELVREAVEMCAPELIVAPMLTTAIAEEIWSRYRCLIVHPGPRGDRGPSSLDWAIMTGARRWGVTVLQANAVMDGGDIWASAEFAMSAESKSSLYRTEVTDAAVEALLLAVERCEKNSFQPAPLDYGRPEVWGEPRPYLRQQARAIDWACEPTSSVVTKLRAADSSPGVLDVIDGVEYLLYGGFEEDELRGEPGAFIGHREGAVCRATVDGAVWIPQARRRANGQEPATLKLEASAILAGQLAGLTESSIPWNVPRSRRTYRQIGYYEEGEVGYLEFSFPGGAMSTSRCCRLLEAYRFACSRPVRVLVLGGTRDMFSNGIDLNAIEAAADPAQESWRNINAMNDLVEAILTTTDRVTVAALAGNAAAGGLMLALAADEVWCRAGAVLNPHYRLMGLHGSEYWTHTLPRRVGPDKALSLTQACLPVSPSTALENGLVDMVFPGGPAQFRARVAQEAERLAHLPDHPARLSGKAARVAGDQANFLLELHRQTELEQMHRNFWEPDEPYHELRRAFVHKQKPNRTPDHLALHRLGPPDAA